MHNLQILLSKRNPPASRTTIKRQGSVLTFFKLRKGISCTSLCLGVLRARNAVIFSLQFAQREKPKKILPMSYLRGQTSNVSSTKRCVLSSRNSSPQRHQYYEVYMQRVLQSLSQKEIIHKNVSARSYVSHRLSPTYPRKTRYKKRLPN